MPLPIPPVQEISHPCRPPPAVRGLAVFRALQLGDMLCAIPALRALRAAFPEARISLVGLPWAAQLAGRFPRYIDDFIPFPGHPGLPEQPLQAALLPAFYAAARARRFDLAVQLHGSGQISNGVVAALGARTVAGYFPADGSQPPPGFFIPYPERGPEPLRLLGLARFLGAPVLDGRLEFPLTGPDEAELQASGLAAGLAPGAYICLHPGARHRDKCWPPRCFALVADSLAAEFGLSVVLTGSPQEADLTAAVARHMSSSAIDAAGPLAIGAMAALMSHARLLVCNDTGVSHIAAALRLPSVVIFSQADMERWSPLDRDRHHCLRDTEGKAVPAVLAAARRLLAINR